MELIIDNKIKFELHAGNICQKVNRKLNALARPTNYLEPPKRRILMNVLFKTQFNYCPIVWVFRSRSLNNEINRLHEHCLRMICNDKRSNFDVLLVKDNSISTHHNNIDSLTVEMYKVVNGSS